jgi:hypothetical protein
MAWRTSFAVTWIVSSTGGCHFQGMVALFPERRITHQSLADLMMHHIVSKATPELEHLRADAACGGPSVSRKYSAI